MINNRVEGLERHRNREGERMEEMEGERRMEVWAFVVHVDEGILVDP